METKQKFIKHLNHIRKGEFFNRITKLLLMFILVILCLVFLIEKWMEKDIALAAFLSLAEGIFLIIGYLILIDARSYYSINDSRIFQCVDKPELITEIVTTSHKIVFEIKGLEDETLYLKDSATRKEFIQLAGQIFGEKKVV